MIVWTRLAVIMTERSRMDKSDTTPTGFRWSRPYKISGTTGLIAGGLFLIAAIELILKWFQPAVYTGWASPLQNIWLLVIFKLLAGFNGVQDDLLYGLNILDITILALVGVMHLGLYMALSKTSKVWSLIALAQPFLGIVIFIATKTAGRSTRMGAELVISIVMLRNNAFNKSIGYIGILSSVPVLIGDFSVGNPSAKFIAPLFGIGYELLITWLFLIARRLFQLGQPGHYHP